jgi:hypothetical protein
MIVMNVFSMMHWTIVASKMQTCECKTTQKILNVNFENKSEE